MAQWKRRFPILNEEIKVKSPAYVCRIIEVCALLHNICKDRNIGLPGEDEGQGIRVEVPMDPCPQQAAPQLHAGRHGGLHYKDEYSNLHFK